MSKPSHQRFAKRIIHLIFLIWQLGFNLKCGSAATLPESEVSTLKTVVDRFKLSVLPTSISPTFCDNAGSTYGYTITCNCSDNDNTTCHITGFKISYFGLTGIIDDAVAELPHLDTLTLSNNELQGSIPSSLGNLARLETLDLSNNKLHGAIPNSLGALQNLKCLYLQNNFLEGIIPPTLGELVSLEEMNLDFNRLWGSIPDDFGNLRNLTSLRIAENGLHGPLPVALGNLNILEMLWLSGNSLTGVLPESYVKLTQMRSFNVAGNKLSGRLPTFVKNWTNVIILAFQGNNFEGPIPKEYFNLSNLQFLFISDLNTGSPIQFPKFANIDSMYALFLRNCSINGRIPKYISELPSLQYLDLSFNNLTDEIPTWKSSLIYLSLASNNLTGSIPAWVFDQATQTRMDLSYNNFSEIEVPVPDNIDDQLNLFACCGCQNSSSPNIKPFMLKPAQMMEAYFPGKKPKFYYLYINSGGEEKTINGNRYDADNYTSRSHVSSTESWAYSSSGDFLAESVNSSTNCMKRAPCKISNSDQVSVYDDARLSPVSLDYYGLNLHNGAYEVTLYFAEIVYTQDAVAYDILRKRIFDVYIQGKRELTDFNIRDQAKGPEAAINRSFNVKVNHSLLHIRFYWPGKGSFFNAPDFNGPLISAISVKPKFEVSPSSLAKNLSISGASALVALLLLLALAWRMGWLEKQELKKKIVVGKDKTVTLKELIKATGNFSKKKMIGSGSLGTVYMAEPKDRSFKVAVKRLSSKFNEKIHELRTQTFHMKSVAHDNLIKLWDVHIGEVEKLLVYEFMEEISLEDALFDRSKPLLVWKNRLSICLGIAKGLKHLHEYPQGSIAHGNIKPTNILLHGDGGVKLSDFGLVSLYDEKELLIKAAKEATKGFNPVEYFQGNVSTESDIYSFGMILLVIVSGRKTEVDRISTQEIEFLLDTAYIYQSKSRLIELVDKRLDGKYNQKEALIILEFALSCTRSGPVERPAISEAVSVLENPNRPLSGIIHHDRDASDNKGDKGVIVYGEVEEKSTADPDPDHPSSHKRSE